MVPVHLPTLLGWHRVVASVAAALFVAMIATACSSSAESTERREVGANTSDAVKAEESSGSIEPSKSASTEPPLTSDQLAVLRQAPTGAKVVGPTCDKLFTREDVERLTGATGVELYPSS